MSKRLLMFCYFYPPQGGVPCTRSVGFSRHLPACGWEPHVVSARNPSRCFVDITGERPPPGVRTTYARNVFSHFGVVEAALRRLGIAGRVCVPDDCIGWIPGAVAAGRRLLRDEDYDAIYVSCSPYSAAIAAMRLAETSGLPFVLDLRDAWTINPQADTYLAGPIGDLDRRVERTVLSAADAIVTATRGICEGYRHLYPEQGHKCTFIPNGYDPAPAAPRPPSAAFTIVYTGFFYGFRTPEALLAALGSLVASGAIPRDDIRFIWAGRAAPWVLGLAGMHGIRDRVDYRGMIPKTDADALLNDADLLYLVIPPGVDPTCMTGKIYPYIASGRPILATVPEGAAADLIREYSPQSTVIVSDGAALRTEIEEALLARYRAWRNGDAPECAPDLAAFAERYSFAATTRDLSDVLNAVAAGGAGS